MTNLEVKFMERTPTLLSEILDELTELRKEVKALNERLNETPEIK